MPGVLYVPTSQLQCISANTDFLKACWPFLHVDLVETPKRVTNLGMVGERWVLRIRRIPGYPGRNNWYRHKYAASQALAQIHARAYTKVA